MKPVKVKIKNPEHAMRVFRVLRLMGYQHKDWHICRAAQRDIRFMYGDSDGTLRLGIVTGVYRQHQGEELEIG